MKVTLADQILTLLIGKIVDKVLRRVLRPPTLAAHAPTRHLSLALLRAFGLSTTATTNVFQPGSPSVNRLENTEDRFVYCLRDICARWRNPKPSSSTGTQAIFPVAGAAQLRIAASRTCCTSILANSSITGIGTIVLTQHQSGRERTAYYNALHLGSV